MVIPEIPVFARQKPEVGAKQEQMTARSQHASHFHQQLLDVSLVGKMLKYIARENRIHGIRLQESQVENTALMELDAYIEKSGRIRVEIELTTAGP